jgi:hypothetical protein
MVNENRQELMQLCELVTKEQDPARLLELITQLSRVLEAEEQRLKAQC